MKFFFKKSLFSAGKTVGITFLCAAVTTPAFAYFKLEDDVDKTKIQTTKSSNVKKTQQRPYQSKKSSPKQAKKNHSSKGAAQCGPQRVVQYGSGSPRKIGGYGDLVPITAAINALVPPGWYVRISKSIKNQKVNWSPEQNWTNALIHNTWNSNCIVVDWRQKSLLISDGVPSPKRANEFHNQKEKSLGEYIIIRTNGQNQRSSSAYKQNQEKADSAGYDNYM